MRYVIGVDEVGRGPLAGPVTVCVVACEEKFYKELKRDKNLPPVGKDSKKLSPKLREQYFKYLKQTCRRESSASLENAEGSLLRAVIIHTSNIIIDKKGISWAINNSTKRGIKKLKINPKQCQILLDGGLKAPQEFKNQKTIIKGDEKEKIIAWASILAKVSRDALMVNFHKKFPEYKFRVHKGYGTKEHRRAVEKYGLSAIHRRGFCKKLSA